jgi:hypothetical protein
MNYHLTLSAQYAADIFPLEMLRYSILIQNPPNYFFLAGAFLTTFFLGFIGIGGFGFM